MSHALKSDSSIVAATWKKPAWQRLRKQMYDAWFLSEQKDFGPFGFDQFVLGEIMGGGYRNTRGNHPYTDMR